MYLFAKNNKNNKMVPLFLLCEFGLDCFAVKRHLRFLLATISTIQDGVGRCQRMTQQQSPY